MMTSRCEYRLLLRQDNARPAPDRKGAPHGAHLARALRPAAAKARGGGARHARARRVRAAVAGAYGLPVRARRAAAGGGRGAAVRPAQAAGYDVYPRYSRSRRARRRRCPRSRRRRSSRWRCRRATTATSKSSGRRWSARGGSRACCLPPELDYMAMDGLRLEARQKLSAIPPARRGAGVAHLGRVAGRRVGAAHRAQAEGGSRMTDAQRCTAKLRACYGALTAEQAERFERYFCAAHGVEPHAQPDRDHGAGGGRGKTLFRLARGAAAARARRALHRRGHGRGLSGHPAADRAAGPVAHAARRAAKARGVFSRRRSTRSASPPRACTCAPRTPAGARRTAPGTTWRSRARSRRCRCCWS